MFAELTEEPKVYLGIFEELVAEISLDFDWDTSLPELDEPWPHHMPERLGFREMVAWLSGRPDATSYLYELSELAEYERTGMVPWADDVTALMEAVA